MQFEFWWLLAFPLFFSLGWIAARIDIKHLLSEYRSLPESYFKGLNFLVNEQPDKAIEAFIQVASFDTETVELHFALGSLFRRRGEVERAIRIHQNLLERADLGQEQKLSALFELGQDYLKAGLLDRAEKLFSDLQRTPYSKAAAQYLLEIYVQEKEWKEAVATAEKLASISNQSYHKEIAHFYCELALAEGAHSNLEEAYRHLQSALNVYRDCVRANILLGDFQAEAGNHEAAIQTWRRIETQNPAHLPLVGERLLSSYRTLNRFGDGVNLLRGYLTKYGSLDMLNLVFQSVVEREGAAAAYALVRDELRKNPSLRGLDSLLEAQLLDAPPEERQDMQLVKNLVQSHVRRLALYRCENCGFKARQFYWHCPACGGWESYPPRRHEE